MKKPLIALVVLLVLLVGLPLAQIAWGRYRPRHVDTTSEGWQHRLDALARAQVFVPGASPPASIDLSRDTRPAAPFAHGASLECRYEPDRTSGTTPKFDCALPSGAVVKVKYGVNPEIHAEVAATRLLSALGFAADYMIIADRVRCYGCPRSPYRSRQIAEWFFLAGVLDRFLDYREYVDFDMPAVESKLEWRAVEVGDAEGFGFYELPAVDPARGGATRADVDAFRLTALFLAHWDNKASNQRLVCLGDRGDDGDAPCASPLLMIQDAGATFGPRKVDHAGWDAAPIWRDAEGCAVSMAGMPWGGATFTDTDISEEGRRLLAAKLTAIDDAQIETLFRSARFPDARTGEPNATDVGPWVATFKRKVAEIAGRTCR